MPIELIKHWITAEERNLQKRRLGRTDLMVSVVGFGGLILPRISREEAVRVVNRALDLGMNFIDTAKSYGDSEEKVGAAISGRRDDCIITSKSLANDKDRLLADIDIGLEHLKTDKIEVYQLHNVSSEDRLKRALAPDGLLDGLKEAQAAGKIGFTAFSGHKKDILVEAIKTDEFDVVQMPINVVDRDTWRDVLPLAVERDMGIISMKPLAGGALTDLSSEIISLALRYVVQQDISTVVVGMKSIDEVEQNVKAGTDRPLSETEREKLERAADSLSKTFCRQCEYCLPCEQGLDIPTIFILDKHYTRFGARESARERYAKLPVKVDDCIECGACESRCPYELPIIEMLKIAEKKLA
jgi:predicted aldo/keto reductase-like oxidoreductase